MAEIEIKGDKLVVHMTGFHKVMALKSQLEIPLSHVRSVETDSPIVHEDVGFKLPGAYLPGVITAGSYLKKGQWSFWDVHDPKKAIVIHLEDEHFTNVVVEVADPEATAAAIRQALPH